MTADRTTAPAATFDAALAGWEARKAAPEGWEQRVEVAALAIFDAANPIMESFPDYWNRVDGGDATRDTYRRLAAAALTADATWQAEQ